jgi:invasion protein IalB
MKSFAGSAALCVGAILMQFAAAQAQQRTTATYEDWTLRCDVRPEPPNQKVCEIVQSTQMQGQGAVVTQVAIGRPQKGEPLKILLQVPINVWLPTGVRFVYAEKEAPVAASFKRCLPAACLADTDLKDDIARKLRALTENGKLEFKDAAQRDVAIPVSFKGFAQAFDSMSKE